MKRCKPNAGTPRDGSVRGSWLVEALVYMGVFSVLMIVVMTSFLKFLEHSRDFQRNAGDIARVLKAGEIWRADIRRATTVVWRPSAEPPVLVLQVPEGTLEYSFSEGQVWRGMAAGGPAAVFLTRVHQSEMMKDARRTVTGWRWEVELKGRKTAANIRPLFSFVAVPGKGDPR